MIMGVRKDFVFGNSLDKDQDKLISLTGARNLKEILSLLVGNEVVLIEDNRKGRELEGFFFKRGKIKGLSSIGKSNFIDFEEPKDKDYLLADIYDIFPLKDSSLHECYSLSFNHYLFTQIYGAETFHIIHRDPIRAYLSISEPNPYGYNLMKAERLVLGVISHEVSRNDLYSDFDDCGD